MFSTRDLLHCRSMMMMMSSPQSHLIWTARKSQILSRLPSFEVTCLHPKLSSSSAPDGIMVIALRIKEFKDDILDTINELSKMVNSDTTFHLNGSTQSLHLFPKRGLHSLQIIREELISHVQYPRSGTKFIFTGSSR